jgi:hypothetical protein
MELTALALALASILIGLRVEEPMRLLDLHRTVAIAGEAQP